MEEIKSLHDLDVEWGSITNLIDKISDIEEKIEGGWPQLIDIITDAIDEEGRSQVDGAETFFCLYYFLFRLYYRLKINHQKRAFNQISKIVIEGEEVYRITNYDYQMFKWVKKNARSDRVSNDYIDIPVGSLNEKQRKAFDRRCE